MATSTYIEEAHTHDTFQLKEFEPHTGKTAPDPVRPANQDELAHIEDSPKGTPMSLAPDDAANIVTTVTKAQLASICLSNFIQGINDAVIGALLPYVQSHYSLEYAVASLVFVGNAIGFIVGFLFVQFLDRKLGRLRTLLVAAAFNIAAYGIIIARPPFAIVAICFAILGFGFSIIMSLNNAYVASAQRSAMLLGITQGMYGLGGTVAPLMGTALVSRHVRWSFFYFISLGLSFANTALFTFAYRAFQEVNYTAHSQHSGAYQSPLLRVLRSRAAIFGAIFIFAYQGAEVTNSGWFASFLIDYRHGDPDQVGYVTAGFWGGITLGRFLLCPLIEKLGDRRCILGLVAVWACFHVVIWLTMDIVGNAVVLAVIGVLSGPIAPVATGVLSKLLDPSVRVSGIGMAWSIGSGGAAVAPFITGVLAQEFGAVVLNPTCIVLCVVMQLAWISLPGRIWKKE